MALCIWRGDAPAVPQVNELPLTEVAAEDVYRLTINGKGVAQVAASSTASAVRAALVAAWNGSPVAELAEVTASEVSGAIRFVADQPGVPFQLAATRLRDSTTTTLAVDTIEPATGPHHWNEPANWSSAATPESGDTVHFVDSASDLLYGLDTGGLDLSALIVEQSFTGRIGLKRLHAAGYLEYRDTYLQVQPAEISIGRGEGRGSGRIKLDTGSAAITLSVWNTGAAEDANLPAVLWKGSHADSEVNLYRGTFGAAMVPGESATLGHLRLSRDADGRGELLVTLGSGVVAVETIDNFRGHLICDSQSIAMLRQLEGTTLIRAGSLDGLIVRGGTVIYNSTGILAAATLSGSARLDFSRDPWGKTVSQPIALFGPSARVIDPLQVVAGLILDLHEAGMSGEELGTNVRWSRETLT